MDRFDDIWKNRFNEEQVPDADWIAPDDRVWKGIAREIEAPQTKRKWWILLLFLITGFLLLVGILGNTGQSTPADSAKTKSAVEPLGTTVSSLSEKQKDAVATASSKKESAVNSSEEQQQSRMLEETSGNQLKDEKSDQFVAKPKAKAENKFEKQIKTASAIGNNLNSTPKNRFVDQRKTTQLQVIEEERTSDQGAARKEQGVEMLLNNNKKVRDPQSLTLHNLSMETLMAKQRSLGVLKPLPALDLPVRKSPLRLGLSGGALYWKHRITDAFRKDFAAFDFNYTDQWAWQIEGTVEYMINDFVAIKTGLQYQRVQNNSGHNSSLEYDPNAESDLGATNKYDLSLATPYGLAPAAFSFSREEQIGTDAVDLLVDFKSKHNIHNLSIPIGVSIYPLGQSGRWVPELSGAFGLNYIVGLDNEIESIQTNHDAIRFVKETAQLNRQEMQALHYDLRIGAGLSHQLTNTLGLRFQYQWMYGIQPVFQLEDYATRIDRHLFSLGLNYRLGSN